MTLTTTTHNNNLRHNATQAARINEGEAGMIKSSQLLVTMAEKVTHLARLQPSKENCFTKRFVSRSVRL
jgi:hypothetical protein